MNLHQEKAASLDEVLEAMGEDVIWKGQTYRALISDNPLNHELALGGFEAKGDCTIKIPRTAFTGERPKLDQRIEYAAQSYRVTRVTDHAQYPLMVLVVSLEE